MKPKDELVPVIIAREDTITLSDPSNTAISTTSTTGTSTIYTGTYSPIGTTSNLYFHNYMLDPFPFDVEVFRMSNQLQVIILTHTDFDPVTYERNVLTLGTFYE